VRSHDMTSFSRHSRQETLIADVTIAVYQLVLHEARPSNWLDLELALWRVVRNRVESWSSIDGGSSVSSNRHHAEHVPLLSSTAEVALQSFRA
jgi:hypothetical protein